MRFEDLFPAISNYRYIITILDILIVSYLLFFIYTLIERSHAIQVIKGILVILVGYLISYFFQFKTMLFIIEEIFKVAFIAVIVLFQPEIRRLLIKLGENEIFGVFKKAPGAMIDLLAESALYLSQQRIGALIVIERKTGLRNYIETGTLLESRFSYPLLTTIFNTSTPLHDGAVIMHGDRIVAAGCMLPLTKRTDLLSIFGTRHRAAIGLSEETDALVIVVSEESGSISIACENRMFYSLQIDVFKSMLYKLLKQDTGSTKTTFGKKITNILKLKRFKKEE